MPRYVAKLQIKPKKIKNIRYHIALQAYNKHVLLCS